MILLDLIGEKMMYLEHFKFPDKDMEHEFFMMNQQTCYNTHYPFQVLSKHGLERLDFAPVTILYGGNGSGKSTALNVIAEKTQIKRDSIFNQSSFYPDYVKRCEMRRFTDIPDNSRIITSDDVFDYMLNIRNWNAGIDQKREDIFKEYLNAKYSDFKFKSMEDYEQLVKVNKARSKTQSRFVKTALMANITAGSNGESAYQYFTEKIGENGLYILDEPENSLSPKLQMELAGFIADSVRFYGCQFILATHSPFFLAMKGAKIYDMDEDPVDIKNGQRLNMSACTNNFSSAMKMIFSEAENNRQHFFTYEERIAADFQSILVRQSCNLLRLLSVARSAFDKWRPILFGCMCHRGG